MSFNILRPKPPIWDRRPFPDDPDDEDDYDEDYYEAMFYD